MRGQVISCTHKMHIAGTIRKLVPEYQMRDKMLAPKQNFPSEYRPSNISITSVVVVSPENRTNKQDRHRQPTGLPLASWEFYLSMLRFFKIHVSIVSVACQ